VNHGDARQALGAEYEGPGLALLEAMAQGRPVVATRVASIAEFAIHGTTGSLHDHQDHEDLAAKVVSLLDDSERAAHLGRAGRALAL
jgi:glycosyltransferase involved in cell wall biosynthesis